MGKLKNNKIVPFARKCYRRREKERSEEELIFSPVKNIKEISRNLIREKENHDVLLF